MNTILFMKGKLIFQALLIVLYQWTSIYCQLNLFKTDPTFKKNSLQFDCLIYHTHRETLAYQELSDKVDESIWFCHGPENNLEEVSEVLHDPFVQKLSFEEIRMKNITIQQLLSWSIAIEVAERYQFYLNTPNLLLNELFFNCTYPRFGLRCEYSFLYSEGMSFGQIVEDAFKGRIAYPKSSNIMAQVPCYVLLSCHRYGQVWCLDWREICDGKIDCFDERSDEEFCFEMEVNECDEDEFRCHNGMCISKDLWENGMGDTDCLDRSDTVSKLSYIDSCFQDPTFLCEEHSCRPRSKPFSCGDGQCVLTLEACSNGRHTLLIDYMITKGNLTDECWIAMHCVTKFIRKSDEELCGKVRNSNKTDVTLAKCEPFFQFPTVPVYSDHVRFFYENVHLRSNDDNVLIPDYACYDQQRCDSIKPDFIYKNLTCVKNFVLGTLQKPEKNFWTLLVTYIERNFSTCSTYHTTYNNKMKYNKNSSLYNCQNSSKLISKHRIMDNIVDCINYDDEQYNNSCQLNDQYRVKCLNTNQCWSPLVKDLFCSSISREEIRFTSFCNGIPNYFYDDNNEEYDDEIGCGDWSCNNIYARCDGFVACSDGRDENSCSRKTCPSHTYACIYRDNYTFGCLPSAFVNDDKPDCLGSLDEQETCHALYPSEDISYQFLCSKTKRCLPVSLLCDKNNDCSDNEDEFCNDRPFTCDEDSVYNRSNIEEMVCALKADENRRIRYFSVCTSSNYPSLEKSNAVEFTHRYVERSVTRSNNAFQMNNHLWPWYCHRGLAVKVWTKNKSSNLTCMCPSSYYGNFCQYQSQRVSLTVKLASSERRATYAVISMLMNDKDEKIDAYDQFTYIVKQSCSIKLNRYLLYSTRPKNISKNYNVRIDIFEKNVLTYVGSWYFPIDFPFLPVNRLAISLNLSNHVLQYSSECSIMCKHGECIKYVNSNKYFCRCHSQWSGIRCDISINCQSCSSNSICIGLTNNQPVCVCPIDRFGPRCELTSTCPIYVCQNNGQCVPEDISIPGNNYTCICSDRFFGQHCEHRKARLDVALNNIDTPLHIVAYFYTISNTSDPIETIVLRKLTLFQHIIIFHVTIPFQLVFIQANNKYYLATIQQIPRTNILTSISSKQECLPTEQLFNSTVLNMAKYQRIPHFYFLCHTRFELNCFIDRDYICLCTDDHHANCMKFNRQRSFECPSNNYCVNKGTCLQDHQSCPSTQICLCRKCYFGDRCQFYAKGLGSTLDEILGYQFQRNILLFKQPGPVQVAAAVTILIFIVGVINSILSIMVFSRKQSQEVGCGIYLLGSSITSLFTMILFLLKFWFLFLSYQDHFGTQNQRHIFEVNCYIEPLLKVCLYLENWVNASMAIERTISVFRGITFNKKLSRQMAIATIIFLFIMIIGHFIPQLINMRVYYDEAEERSWCVVRYVSKLETYTTAMIFIHYFVPLVINLFSIFCVIYITAHQKAITQAKRATWDVFQLIIRKYRYALTSCVINICVTLPYVIISIILDCSKSSKLLWFYLIGYFLSFLPTAFIFILYVLPSSHYRKEFSKLITHIHRQYEIFKLNSRDLR